MPPKTLAVFCAETEEIPYGFKWDNGIIACPQGCCRFVPTDAGHHILICVGGVGMVAAASAVTHLIDVHGIHIIIAVGFCGRLSTQIPWNRPLLVSRTANYGKTPSILNVATLREENIQWYQPSDYLITLAKEAGIKSGLYLPEVVSVSAENPVHSATIAEEINKQLKADVVDMETAALAQVCQDRGCSWLSIRICADNADSEAPKHHLIAKQLGIPSTLATLLETILKSVNIEPSYGYLNTTSSMRFTGESEILREDTKWVWHPFCSPNTSDRTLPSVIVQAQGFRVWDEYGRCYYDGVAGTKNVCIGHSHPALFPYILAQANTLSHWSADGFTSPKLVEFSRRLAGFFPGSLKHVFTNTGGSEAVETALKMARTYHMERHDGHRQRVLALTSGYHGATAGALSITGHGPSRLCGGVMFEGTVFVEPPESDSDEDVNRALEAAMRMIDILDPASFSCFIFETTQGLGGVKPLPLAYIDGLIDMARDIGALSIADEIASGLGRTGRWFDFTRASKLPDIVTCGKALSNGTIPLSATIANDNVYETVRKNKHELCHGHTYSGHPLGASAGCKVLEILEEMYILSHVNYLASRFLKEIAPKLTMLPWVRDLRVTGLWIAIELHDPITLQPLSVAGLSRELIRRGLFNEMLGPVICLSPPLTISVEDLSIIGGILVETFKDWGEDHENW